MPTRFGLTHRGPVGRPLRTATYVTAGASLKYRSIPFRAEASVSQLKSEEQILQLLAPLYRDLGRDPRELVRVAPSYGGWLNALRFCVVRADNATTWLTRKDIDSENRRRLMRALESFSQDPHAGCPAAEMPAAATGKVR
jgi:hypothetical protein